MSALAFLCPVRSVRDAANSKPSDELSDAALGAAHDRSDAYIVSLLPLAVSDRCIWAALLAEFRCVFCALEDWAASPAAAALLPSEGAAALLRVRRAHAFDADLSFFSPPPVPGGEEPSERFPQGMAAPTAAYVARIRACGDMGDSGARLNAVTAATMALALLSGGQTIRSVQRAAMGLRPGDAGSAIFEFHFADGDAASVRRQLRDLAAWGLESDGGRAEKLAVYARNDAIVAAVFAARPASVARRAAAAARVAGRLISAAVACGPLLMAVAVALAALLLRTLLFHLRFL